ncbi:unnamed protein product [Triticum turgidum subsp. durum]|uniref:DUF4005 domain-containing protein n=1 Tax=Triticum turgidum subsp. durum TaxID=4567 RepID=A0A9R0VIH5_TRITD|nr:unnamed protein product [Triticum turgidum subsp. durum]
MGGSGKWVKSLIGLKKPDREDCCKNKLLVPSVLGVGGKGRKWRLQAIVRGRQVRKQAAVTLRCMQALVRVQARIRARRVRMSTEGQAVQKLIQARRTKLDILREAEEGWCDSQGTLEAVRVKLQKRQEGAIKRERAIAYVYHGVAKCNQPKGGNGRSNQSGLLLKHQHCDKNNGSWSWLERWMAARPWENRLMEEHNQTNASSPDLVPSKNCEDAFGVLADFSEPNSVKVRKNNVSKRISAKPPGATHPQRFKAQSISSLSTELHNDESSASSSSCFASTPLSFSTLLTPEKTNNGSGVRSRPNYMSLTESIKAKRKPCGAQKTTASKQLDDRKAPGAELKAAKA